jgi:hypothetical protein
MMSDSASDIGEGLVIGFKYLHEFVKDSGANLSVFSFAGVKRKNDKSADGHDDDQYGKRCGVSKSFHWLSFLGSLPYRCTNNMASNRPHLLNPPWVGNHKEKHFCYYF